MIRRRFLVGLGGLALWSVGCAKKTPELAGRWVGDFRHPAMTLLLEVTVDSAARVSLRPWQLRDAPAGVISSGDTVELVVATESDTAHFRGALTGTTWSGVARRGRETVPFELRRTSPLTETNWAAITGTYRTPDGRLIGIARFTEFGDRPFLVDYAGGRIGPLLPIGSNRLLVGRSVVAPLFPADSVTLDLDPAGKPTGLRYFETGRPPIVAKRMATRDEEISFSNGPVSLAGTLTLPEGAGPHPAIVLVHGSNAQTRDGMGPWTRYFAGLGFAVLSFDKRGTGRSAGDWKQADFGILAGDVLSGVRALAARPDIRPRQDRTLGDQSGRLDHAAGGVAGTQ